MAEETPATSAPAAAAGKPVAERAPSAEPKAGPADSTPETRPVQEKDNATEQPAAPSGGASAPEPEKSEEAETKPEEPSASAETADEKEKEEDDEEEAAATSAEAEAVPAPETNGTPALARKGGNVKRKSTGGVAEHRTRRLGRKKSQHRITHLDAKPGEYYLARLKSYPPWPSIICDEEMLPQSLLNTRPVTTKQADGTYKEPYADGGKRVHERTFPIMFLETNEFAWIPNTELTPLTPEMCKEAIEKGKPKALLAAYKVALEQHDLQYFKDLLADHQRALQQEAEAREAKAAAKADREEKKKKRKSMEVVEDQEDVDMAEVEEEEGKKPKATKKRKKDVDSEGEAEKTPKAATKLKLTTPKTPATAETKKATTGSAKAARSRTTGTKRGGKAAASDEEMAVETPKEPEKTIDPQEAKVKKEKEILYIRHKLQKGFISRDQAPKEEEMATMSNFFSKLEAHSDLEVSIIRATKINKVLKMIVKLNTIPKDEEYHFRRRAIDILAKWKNLLESDTTPAPAKESKPTANGVHKEDEGDESVDGKASVETPTKTEKTDTEEKETTEEKPAKEESAAESKDQDTPMPDADAAEEKAQAPEEPAKESEEAAPKEGETEKTAEEAAA